ncbi:MAG: hypothetical protein ACJ768_05570 [Gaiellaceae bacterium]
MTRRVRQPVVLALAAALLLPVAGCGSSDKKGDPIAKADADQIVARLQEAKRRASPLRCNDLRRDTIPALQDQVASLPTTVDADVRQTLSDGVNHLNDLVNQDCNQQQTTTQDTTPTQTTTDTTPTTTQTTPTNTNTDTNTNTNTDTNTNTNTNTTPPNTDTSGGGTPSPNGATTGGKGTGTGKGGSG